MKRRALVTGGSGFVGAHLCRTLCEGGWEVVCTGHHATLTGDCSTLSGLTYASCDITDYDLVRALIEQQGPFTHVFHLAAVTYVPESIADPVRTFRVNVEGTIHLLRALHATQPRARVVYVSSSEVYGPPQFLPITEEHPMAPRQPYAISKAAAEFFCTFAEKTYAQEIVRVRPFNHSGRGQSSSFALSAFAYQVAMAEAGRQPPVLRVGNLDVERDFLHVRDVVQAYVILAEHGRAGDVYNVCSGKSYRLRDLAEYLIAQSRIPLVIEADPGRMRPSDVPRICGSPEKISEAVGWKPTIPINAVLDDLLAYWRERVEQES